MNPASGPLPSHLLACKSLHLVNKQGAGLQASQAQSESSRLRPSSLVYDVYSLTLMSVMMSLLVCQTSNKPGRSHTQLPVNVQQGAGRQACGCRVGVAQTAEYLWTDYLHQADLGSHAPQVDAPVCTAPCRSLLWDHCFWHSDTVASRLLCEDCQ